MIRSFGPKSRDNPPKCIQQLKDTGRMFGRVIRTCPQSLFSSFSKCSSSKTWKVGESKLGLHWEVRKSQPDLTELRNSHLNIGHVF